MGFSSRTCGSNSSMASPVAGRTPKACRGRWQEVRMGRSPAPTLFKSGGLVKNRDDLSKWETSAAILNSFKILGTFRTVGVNM
jgi:hypothetical protein